MVKNISRNTSFYCMNGHEKPVLMKERERTDDNKDNFLACPKYMRKDEAHPDGFSEDEHGCTNRISLSTAGDIIVEFNKIVQDDLMSGIIADYEGMLFVFKNQIEVTVLKQKGDELHLGILNRKAVEGNE